VSDDDDYRARVALWGPCVCDGITCVSEADDDTGPWFSRFCRLCHYLDPEWPCPAEDDADYPDVVTPDAGSGTRP
jgi:hypothetical protein